jgi:GDPmannose 4,6-dehydratase
MTLILVLGASGQDGSYACEQLTNEGHKVIGAVRKSATYNLSNLTDLFSCNYSNFTLGRFDLSDESSIYRIIADSQPDFIFNYADQDHVSWSHSLPLYSCDVTSRSVNTILEAVRVTSPNSVLIQPISSNIYGQSRESLISESSIINPSSPYAIAKASALYICRYYREAYKLKVINPILFNHESERRTTEYVSRKISTAAAKIKLNMQESLTLGDISAQIDWGYAPEFVSCMISLGFSEKYGEYIIGSSSLTSVKQFAQYCFQHLGLDLEDYLNIDPQLLRPTKNKPLRANIHKVVEAVGFSPKIYGKSLAEKLTSYDFYLNSRAN